MTIITHPITAAVIITDITLLIIMAGADTTVPITADHTGMDITMDTMMDTGVADITVIITAATGITDIVLPALPCLLTDQPVMPEYRPGNHTAQQIIAAEQPVQAPAMESEEYQPNPAEQQTEQSGQIPAPAQVVLAEQQPREQSVPPELQEL